MIIKKDELFSAVDTKSLRIASIAIRFLFIYHILWPINGFPLGAHTLSLLPVDHVLNFFSVGAYEKLFPLFQDNYKWLGLLLVGLSFLKKLEKISFLFLSLFSFVFVERFFLISHIADYFYSFIFFHLALLPPGEKNTLRVIDLAPLFFLRTIIYGFNIFQKISTWGAGKGLSQSLRHSELSQFSSFALEFPKSVFVLNYFLILVLMITITYPFVSYKFERTKFGLSLLCICYHLGGLYLFSLDGISLPFIFLEVMFWGSLVSTPHKDNINAIYKRTFAAIIILIVGFFNTSARGNHFDRSLDAPMGHNWYMFAPPPSISGAWQLTVSEASGGEKILSQSQWAEQLQIPTGMRSYKYFYNLRRIDSFIFVEDLMKASCPSLGAKSIKAKYSGSLLESGDPFEKNWPTFLCD